MPHDHGTFRRTWTTSELARLRRLAPLGAEKAADQLGRSLWSIRSQAHRHGISLVAADAPMPTHRGTFEPSWTPHELAELRRLAPEGARAAADALGRSLWSVKKQAQRRGISLRRPGSRAGTFLGQPRYASITGDHGEIYARIRDGVIGGEITVEHWMRRAMAFARGEPLCPTCAVRPIEVERTGTCEDCHRKALAMAHALEPGSADAQRHLDAERQRKHRATAVTSPPSHQEVTKTTETHR